MSNEKKENENSLMNSVLKSTVGKLAILAGAAMSMSSCTTTTYSNATGYWERTQSSGVSAGQVLQGVDIIGRSINGHHHGSYHGGHYHGGYFGSSGCGHVPGVRYMPNKCSRGHVH